MLRLANRENIDKEIVLLKEFLIKSSEDKTSVENSVSVIETESGFVLNFKGVINNNTFKIIVFRLFCTILKFENVFLKLENLHETDLEDQKKLLIYKKIKHKLIWE